MLAEAATYKLDVWVLIHHSSDELFKRCYPVNRIVVGSSSASGDDDCLDGLEVLFGGELVLETKEVLPFLVSVFNELSHEQSLIDPPPVFVVFTDEHCYLSRSHLAPTESGLELWVGGRNDVDSVLVEVGLLQRGGAAKCHLH